MYFSAIFYSPAQFHSTPIIEQLINLNPIYQYISAFRDTAMYGHLLTAQQLLTCTLWALVMLAIGCVVFKKNQDKFVLYM